MVVQHLEQAGVDELEAALGRNLRSRRINAGLTQVELAERANVSLGALRHLEGGAGANTTTLVKVLRALGATGWIDALAPPAAGFSPLAKLAERQRDTARARKGPPRVRKRNRDLPA